VRHDTDWSEKIFPAPDFSSSASVKDLAAPFLTQFPISGLTISLFDQAEMQSTIYSSDPIAAQLDEAQFDLGEGPTWDTYRSHEVAHIGDVGDVSDRWPIFANNIAPLHVHALYVFPLLLGTLCIGVVASYRFTGGRLTDAAVHHGLRLSRAAAVPALLRAVEYAIDDNPPLPVEMRREVHQAVGMVLVQLETNTGDALARIRALAYSRGRTVQAIAHEVVTGRINFHHLPA
jgi:hypothetical protein